MRFAVRTLGKSPLFAAAAVLSLVLGMGANRAVFTLLDRECLRLLPVRNPEDLVLLASGHYFEVLALATASLAAVAAFAGYIPAVRATRVDPIRALRHE